REDQREQALAEVGRSVERVGRREKGRGELGGAHGLSVPARRLRGKRSRRMVLVWGGWVRSVPRRILPVLRGRQREEGGVVRELERLGEVGVQLPGLEAAEAGHVPEPARDVAADLVAAVGGEGGPALGEGEEDGVAGARGDVPEAEGAVLGGGGEGAAA